MKCTHARRLFAAYWDDETTLAEREWLEGHFASCRTCRLEYERYARTLEVMGTLPRIEPAHDMAERVLQRARRADTAPDRLPVQGGRWIPVTAGIAAAVLLTLTIVGPWLLAPRANRDGRGPVARTVSEPVLVPTAPSALPGRTEPGTSTLAAGRPLPDSLFDHSEDVEFVLDPVTLHRGRAALARPSGQEQGQRAVITF